MKFIKIYLLYFFYDEFVVNNKFYCIRLFLIKNHLTIFHLNLNKFIFSF